MTTLIEATQIFWIVTEDMVNNGDQETREENENHQVHRMYADKWIELCAVNEFEPDEFFRITKDLMTDGQRNTIGFLVDQVNNMMEDNYREMEGE